MAENAIKKYGCDVVIQTDNETIKTRAFIEPLRYGNKTFKRTEKYLYIGVPKCDLIENNSIIQMGDKNYIVEKYNFHYVKNKSVYVWAILLSLI